MPCPFGHEDFRAKGTVIFKGKVDLERNLLTDHYKYDILRELPQMNEITVSNICMMEYTE